MVDVETAYAFTGPTGQDIMYHVLNNNSNVYAYEFTYPSLLSQVGHKWLFPNYYPVPHSGELGYVWFGNWDNYLKQGIVNATDTELANFFGESWANFIKTGKPSTDNSWAPATMASLTGMEYMDINPNRQMRQGYRLLDRAQLNRIMPIWVGQYPQNIPDYNNGSIVPSNLYKTN
uniref:Carboxylesterase type B domain-containing protein n=1 Tax=Acrobeloides nanus TaxID=290746 RepID=A0A914CCD2_9BILA